MLGLLFEINGMLHIKGQNFVLIPFFLRFSAPW